MVRIRIPATSANIGPGFDTLGIAFRLYNTYTVTETEEGLSIDGCCDEYKNENNLVYTSMKTCFEALGYKYKGISLKMQCDIPVSRGLGSSAACILGGVMAANEIAGGGLSKRELLALATTIEGHPDNVAPALYGGFTAALTDKDKVYVEALKLSEGLCFYALIPDFPLSTGKSRGVLPMDVELKAAIYNIGRTAFLISGLGSGNREAITLGSQDALHQKYRGALIDGYTDIVEGCTQQGAWGVFLSGAGPTIMAIAAVEDVQFADRVKRDISGLKNKWQIKKLEVDSLGAVIVSTTD